MSCSSSSGKSSGLVIMRFRAQIETVIIYIQSVVFHSNQWLGEYVEPHDVNIMYCVFIARGVAGIPNLFSE